MKNQVEILSKLSEMIDLNLFYVIRFWSDEITLQGGRESLKEVNQLFKTPKKLSENNWFESEHNFQGTKIKIILT